MKKNKTRKLVLNKIKVAILNDNDKHALKGGGPITIACETVDCQGTNSVITYQDCGKPILW